MDIQLYAFILLIVRIVSMALLGAVIAKQIRLFKLPIDKEIRHYRRVLFVLALAIFFGNVIPAIIDVLTITGDLARTVKTVNGVSLIYSMDAAGTALLSSILIFWLYRMSHTVDASHPQSDHTLLNEEK